MDFHETKLEKAEAAIIHMNPKVSVCMPTYNQARFLPEAIESVLRQSYRYFEFIIIDDCSKDNTSEIIRKYAASDDRIRAVFNERNAGMVNNWNKCLQLARGEYIKYLFGDDVLSSPHALERMVSVLDTEEKVALVASTRYYIDERSAVIKLVSDYLGRRRSRGAKVVSDCLVDLRNNIGEPSVVLFRKKWAERGFNPEYRQIVDLEMWFHILEHGTFAYIDEPLCSFRVHANQETRRNFEQILHIDDFYLLLRDYAEKPYVRISSINRSYMYFLRSYVIWKLYKTHKRISREEARDLIQSRYHYSMRRFVLVMPFFRLYKFYRRNRIIILSYLRVVCSFIIGGKQARIRITKPA